MRDPIQQTGVTLAGKTEIDLEEFRRVLGHFATGVAVVTTLDDQGSKVGMTISSFNSVSLDPPLVLWSVAEDSQTYDVFVAAKYFAVHVLAMHQKDLVNHFAQSGEDRFEQFDCREGFHSVPVLPEFAACFECSTEYVYPGGDHKIIVGRVHSFEERDADPLIVHRSRFLRTESPM